METARAARGAGAHRQGKKGCVKKKEERGGGNRRWKGKSGRGGGIEEASASARLAMKQRAAQAAAPARAGSGFLASCAAGLAVEGLGCGGGLLPGAAGGDGDLRRPGRRSEGRQWRLHPRRDAGGGREAVAGGEDATSRARKRARRGTTSPRESGRAGQAGVGHRRARAQRRPLPPRTPPASFSLIERTVSVLASGFETSCACRGDGACRVARACRRRWRRPRGLRGAALRAQRAPRSAATSAAACRRPWRAGTG